MLSEFEFKWVPPHVNAMVQTTFAWFSSLVTELGNRQFRQRLKRSVNGSAAASTLWKAEVDSTVLDDCKRPGPRKEDGDPLDLPPKNAFEA